MLLLKLVVVLFLLLPFNLLMIMICTSGICVAFSALWTVRSLAWVSACIVLMCMHICCTCLSSARSVMDWCHQLTVQGKHKLTAKPPSAQLPSPSFHDIRALHAYAMSDSSQKGPTVVIYFALTSHSSHILWCRWICPLCCSSPHYLTWSPLSHPYQYNYSTSWL